MIYRKIAHVSSFIILGAMLAFQYQNCAPPAGIGHQASIVEGGLPVSVIDDVKGQTDLTFIEKSVQIHTASDELVFDGICGRGTAKLKWRLYDADSRVLKEGFADCRMGGFQVSFTSGQDLECGEDYRLVAHLGAGSVGELVVQRRCVPQVTLPVIPEAKAQLAALSDCAYEGNFNSANGASCSLVCYEGGKVRTERAIDLGACSL